MLNYSRASSERTERRKRECAHAHSLVSTDRTNDAMSAEELDALYDAIEALDTRVAHEEEEEEEENC